MFQRRGHNHGCWLDDADAVVGFAVMMMHTMVAEHSHEMKN